MAVKETLRLLQEAVGGADFSGEMTLIHAMRLMSETLSQLADGQAEHSAVLRELVGTLHAIDKRLIVIENNSMERDLLRNREDLAALEVRVEVLERAEQRRTGAVSLLDWLGRSWPAVLGFAGLVAFLAKYKDIL